MTAYQYPKSVENQAEVDVNWLLGRTVEKVEKIDYTWFFCFDDKSSIGTESS